jgi:LysR family transcriptional regulator, cys regulon transcriptional activator
VNFQQLRSAREAVRRGFNLTLVAEALHTSQPGVSRQIRELEQELGIDLFHRAGKRLTGLTEPGKTAMPIIERLLLEADNIRRAGADFAASRGGTLTVAATHSQARYALPPAVRDFLGRRRGVRLHLQQGSPRQIAQQLLAGEVDIGIATEGLADCDGLVALPCYHWTHVVVVPRGHALALEHERGIRLTMEQLGRFPLITYEPGYTGRGHIDDGFSHAGIEPEIALSAMDADVIKTYVELGLGVGIIAAIAYDSVRDPNLVAIDARHLFATNVTRLAIRRGSYLRDYTYEFIGIFAPPLTRAVIDQALQPEPVVEPAEEPLAVPA